MKERPILFSGPMVRALMNGSKTQTRRVVKPQPPNHMGTVRTLGDGDWQFVQDAHTLADSASTWRCPYGQPGDRLWVRETCRAEELPDGLDGVRYLADNGFASIQPNEEGINRWLEMRDYGKRPSPVARVKTVPAIHMPRWASRITLEITSVRVERLQDICEADALAEGVQGHPFRPDDGWPICTGYMVGPDDGKTTLHPKPQDAYQRLWEEINGPESWEANPWVWVVGFKRVEVIAARAAIAKAGGEA